MKRLEESEALHGRARALVDALEKDPSSLSDMSAAAKQEEEEAFDRLACDIARFQARALPGFARLLAAKGIDPQTLMRAADIPGVPTDAFKTARVSAFSREETPTVFRTSGTTLGARGEHFLRTTETDDRATRAFGRLALGLDAGTESKTDRDDAGAPSFLVLTPSPVEAPDSSLIHMFETLRRAFGAETERTYFLSNGTLDVEAFVLAVERAHQAGRATLVFGTSFSFVHLVDALGSRSLTGKGIRLALHTGGTKGRSREITPRELEEEITRAFGIPSDACIAEYGMTELSSEFYRSKWIGSPSHYCEPPWARVVAVDPTTLKPVNAGEIGIAKIIDLLNVDSAVSVLTQDLVKREGRGFSMLGRAPGAIPRGCSLSVEEMLG